MATATDIITRALRKRIREAGYVPEAEELVDGLTELNDMLSDWAIDGIDFAHVTLEASDTLDVPDNHLSTVILSLAERLNEYGAQLDPSDVLRGIDGRRRLRAIYFTVDPLRTDRRTRC